MKAAAEREILYAYMGIISACSWKNERQKA